MERDRDNAINEEAEERTKGKTGPGAYAPFGAGHKTGHQRPVVAAKPGVNKDTLLAVFMRQQTGRKRKKERKERERESEREDCGKRLGGGRGHRPNGISVTLS